MTALAIDEMPDMLLGIFAVTRGSYYGSFVKTNGMGCSVANADPAAKRIIGDTPVKVVWL